MDSRICCLVSCFIVITLKVLSCGIIQKRRVKVNGKNLSEDFLDIIDEYCYYCIGY